MKRFNIKVLLFLFPIIIFSSLGFIYKSAEDKGIERYNTLKLENNIILIGDSKPLVDFNYSMLKNRFEKSSIINLSLWARNPQYIYSVYKSIFAKKKIRNSIIVYNLTYRQILNRSENLYSSTNSILISKRSLKELIKEKLNKKYEFQYNNNENGFIQIIGQKFGYISEGYDFYKTLALKSNPDLYTQLMYVDSIKTLFNSNNNIFIVTELPHDIVIDSIYQNMEYYSTFHQYIEKMFDNRLYFGYLKELDNANYWYNRDHLNNNGTDVFTPIFAMKLDSLIKEIRTSNI